MSHFYGETQGNRGEATRCGHKNSGIRSRAASWNVGCTVRIWWDAGLKQDVMSFTIDNGNGSGKNRSMTFALTREDIDDIFELEDPLLTLTEKIARQRRQPCATE